VLSVATREKSPRSIPCAVDLTIRKTAWLFCSEIDAARHRAASVLDRLRECGTQQVPRLSRPLKLHSVSLQNTNYRNSV
jgi:hypothetical protein